LSASGSADLRLWGLRLFLRFVHAGPRLSFRGGHRGDRRETAHTAPGTWPPDESRGPQQRRSALPATEPGTRRYRAEPPTGRYTAERPHATSVQQPLTTG